MTAQFESCSGIFWTWQDEHVERSQELEKASRIEAELRDIAAHGFGSVLIQPRGCRYGVDDPLFIKAVARAVKVSRDLGVAIWFHLDPRSCVRYVIDQAGEAVEYLVVCGPGDEANTLPLHKRPLEIESRIENGRFEVRLGCPTGRPYHVHSDGALWFQPVRLERCFAFRKNEHGQVLGESIRDITSQARMFTNYISCYVDIIGHWTPPSPGNWYAAAFPVFGSNYPDFAGKQTREVMCALLDRYAEEGAILDGIWWDEPGYCTGFDRRFRNDRGRIPISSSIASLYQAKTGREVSSDLIYLFYETDDGRWGKVRKDYYETLSDAVFGMQSLLGEHARRVFGPSVEIGVHHTWHQNADDLVHGSMNWWKGAGVLTGGFTDIGSAEEVENEGQFGELTAMLTLAGSLARRARRERAYINLWGVNYGFPEDKAGPEILNYWADLMGTFGCRWLAHIYGPTGYFEKPSVWGPGYPQHPTWEQMPEVTRRLSAAHAIAEGRIPHSEVGIVYPLGAITRLGSDLANPIARYVHMLVHSLLREGYEIDLVSPFELAAGLGGKEYAGLIYLHPFGASPAEVESLGYQKSLGVKVLAFGLPPVAGEGYSSWSDWQGLFGCHKGERRFGAHQGNRGSFQGSRIMHPNGQVWPYRGLPGWGRPAWPLAGEQEGSITVDGVPVGVFDSNSCFGQVFLEGMLDYAPKVIAALGLQPSWGKPDGCFATRTFLGDGSVVVRACPSRFGGSFSGTFSHGSVKIGVSECRGFFGVRVDVSGTAVDFFAPDIGDWWVERG